VRYLHVREGAEEHELPLSAGTRVRVGRGADVDLRLQSDDVSRAHADVRLRDGALEVRDLGSVNGTWLLDGMTARRVDAGDWHAVPAHALVRFGAVATVQLRETDPAATLRPGERMRPGPLTIDPPPTFDPANRATGFLACVAQLVRCVLADGCQDGAVELALQRLAGALPGCREISAWRTANGAPVALAATRVDGTAAPASGLPGEVLEAMGRGRPAWIEGTEGARWLVVPGSARAAVVARLAADSAPPGELVTEVLEAVALLLDRAFAGLLAATAPEGDRAAADATPPLPHSLFQGEVSSHRLRDVLEHARRAAPTRHPVLVLGETGVGKELVARFIHAVSGRTGDFVAVSIAELPPGLVEAELFGHVAGAFTGAIRARPGRFAAADGGTLFLDELGEVPLEIQVKLLRVVQHGRLEPVGSDATRDVDVRLVAATNVDLERAVAEGRFRADLYHRLNTITLRVPPLRERRAVEDLPGRLAGEEPARQRQDLLAALGWLLDQPWPGNVRELESRVARAAVVARGDVVRPADLQGQADPRRADGGDPYEKPWRDARRWFEREYFQRLLLAAEGNVTRVAELSGVERSNVHAKLKDLGLRENRA
jgi:DNA-binding NtrC family response regulator